MNRPDFVRRSQLITPASSVKIIVKAAAVECDSLIIDLEDAIAPAKKAEARETLRNALCDIRVSDKELGVRINGLESAWCLDDMLALEGLPIDTVVVPKVHRPEDLYTYDQLLRQLELRGGQAGITLQVLIESARGLENAGAIAVASKRCRSLIFGVGDFMADTGIAFTAATLFPCRARMVVAAAAAGVQAIDHVHPELSDLEGLAEAGCEAKALGFTGKWAIHPQQVATINAAFSPTDREIAEARRVIDAYEKAIASGVGAITLDGAMVDEAMLKIMQRRASVARRLGLWNEQP